MRTADIERIEKIQDLSICINNWADVNEFARIFSAVLDLGNAPRMEYQKLFDLGSEVRDRIRKGSE